MQGIYPYLVSPLTDAGKVHARALHQLVNHLIDAGVHGLSPLGSTGEIMYLTPAQREGVLRETVEAAAGRVSVVPGIAGFSTADTVAQAELAQRCGADGIVVMQQLYYPIAPAGVEDYFRTVARATDLPVVLYTNPKLGDVLSIDSIVRIAEEPNVQYIKDATGKTGRILSLLNRTQNGLKVFAASAHIPALVFELGGVGWMGGPACLVPEASVALWEAHRAGDNARMWELQRVLWPLHELFQRHNLAAFIKGALGREGFEVGNPLPPQTPLPHSVYAEYDSIIAKVREVLNQE